MEITFLGHSSFRLRGKTATLVTDPFESKMIGLKFPKVSADIVTISHDHNDHNQADLVSGSPFVISGPGEYEVKGVSVYGLATFHDEQGGAERGKNTVYVINIDGMKLAHLGDLGHELSEGQLEELADIDILMIPVGGVYTIDAKRAAQVAGQIDARIVIPMHYKLPGLTLGLAGVNEFLKEMGADEVRSQPKLFLTRDKLPEEQAVMVLEKRG